MISVSCGLSGKVVGGIIFLLFQNQDGRLTVIRSSEVGVWYSGGM
jgi:hypothetical protein